MCCQWQLVLDGPQTPHIMPQWCLECHKGSQSQSEAYLKMSWKKRGHGSHVAKLALSILQIIYKGNWYLLPKNCLIQNRTTSLHLNRRWQLPTKWWQQTIQPPMEFRLLCRNSANCVNPKSKKLKSGYSATANLIFKSWSMTSWAQEEDRQLTQREAIELI